MGQYPSTVEVASFKGMKKEFHDVSALDKKNNRIIHTKALINRPNYVRERKIMSVSHPHEFEFNLNTGKKIEPVVHKKELHGISSCVNCFTPNNDKKKDDKDKPEPKPEPTPEPKPARKSNFGHENAEAKEVQKGLKTKIDKLAKKENDLNEKSKYREHLEKIQKENAVKEKNPSKKKKKKKKKKK